MSDLVKVADRIGGTLAAVARTAYRYVTGRTDRVTVVQFAYTVAAGAFIAWFVADPAGGALAWVLCGITLSGVGTWVWFVELPVASDLDRGPAASVLSRRHRKARSCARENVAVTSFFIASGLASFVAFGNVASLVAEVVAFVSVTTGSWVAVDLPERGGRTLAGDVRRLLTRRPSFAAVGAS